MVDSSERSGRFQEGLDGDGLSEMLQRLLIFLDNLYVVSTPTLATTVFQTIAEEVKTHAEVKS